MDDVFYIVGIIRIDLVFKVVVEELFIFEGGMRLNFSKVKYVRF